MSAAEARQCFFGFVQQLLRAHQARLLQLRGEEALEEPFIRSACEALSATCRAIGAPHYMGILQHLAAGGPGASPPCLQARPRLLLPLVTMPRLAVTRRGELALGAAACWC